MVWDKAEAKADQIKECLMNDLKYDDVQILTNLSKEQVIEKFDELQLIAGNFSNNEKSQRARIIITVAWIAYFVAWWKNIGEQPLK